MPGALATGRHEVLDKAEGAARLGAGGLDPGEGSEEGERLSFVAVDGIWSQCGFHGAVIESMT
jgi:hypothetical protein